MLIEAHDYDRVEYLRLEGFYELGMNPHEEQSGTMFTDEGSEYNTITEAKSVHEERVKRLRELYPQFAEWIGFSITIRLLRETE